MHYNSKKTPGAARRLLVVDSHYSFEAVRERGLEDSITCRDLDGFFEHVWTVHPFATLVTSENWTSRYGKPEWHTVTLAHTFVDGKVGRFAGLSHFPALNFLISQVGIIFDLVHLIRKEKISVIRAGDPLYNGLLGWVLSRLCDIPFLVRVGGNFDKNYEVTGRIGMPMLFKTRRIEKFFEQFVLSRADYVAGANQDNLNFAILNGAKPETSTLFRYGNLIAKQHFVEPESRQEGRSLLRKLGVEPGQFLLNVARQDSLKHPDHVLRVLAEIRKRGHDLKAVLAGDGELREELIELANTLGVKDQVVLCGNQSQEWLARVMPLASVVVSPFMGRALTEAALGAAPIVAYDVDWQKELIQTGITGELVPHRNWEEMTNAVERYLDNPIHARSMGSAARKRALEMMDPEQLTQHEQDTYLKLFNDFKATSFK